MQQESTLWCVIDDNQSSTIIGGGHELGSALTTEITIPKLDAIEPEVTVLTFTTSQRVKIRLKSFDHSTTGS